MAAQNYLKPPKRLMRHVGRAIADFKMINEGDRILLGVSGVLRLVIKSVKRNGSSLRKELQ